MSLGAATAFAVAVATCAFLIVVVSFKGAKNGRALPPGPRGLPFIGNTHQIDSAKPRKTFTKWKYQYGDLVYCRVLGIDTFVVNSEQISRDLLEKRSHNYSDKTMVPQTEILNLNNNTAWASYTDTWRMHRRIFHQALRADVVEKYQPTQLRAAYKLLENLLSEPDSYEDHFQTHSAAIVVSVVYGYEAKSRRDHLVSVIERANHFIVGSATPLTFAILANFPFLLKLPSWIPDGGFKQLVNSFQEHTRDMIEVPYQYTREKMTNGTGTPSLVSDALLNAQSKHMPEDYEFHLKNSAATLFSAAADTTFTTLQAFLYFMVQHPDTQHRAQAAIDAVTGTDRLPTFGDRDALPIVDALMRETMRRAPALPLDLPHGVTNDDIYDGYFIPKGSNVIVNTWAILHDETRFADPMKFDPDRFLDANGHLTDDQSHLLAFGFGRRICPGRHLADASLWSAMACMLAMFNFAKAKDTQGREINIDEAEWSSGLTSRPMNFKCSITPRFPSASDKLRRALEELDSHEL